MPAGANGGLCLPDVGELGVPHGGCRLVYFGNVSTRLGVKTVAFNEDGCRAQTGEQLLSLDAVRHQTSILDVGMGLLDQPLGRLPGSGGPPAGDTLDTSWRADILDAKADK